MTRGPAGRIWGLWPQGCSARRQSPNQGLAGCSTQDSLPPPLNQVLGCSALSTRVCVVSPAFTPLQCPHGPGPVHPTAVSAWSGLRSPCRSVCSCRRGLLTCRSKHELFGPSEKVWWFLVCTECPWTRGRLWSGRALCLAVCFVFTACVLLVGTLKPTNRYFISAQRRGAAVNCPSHLREGLHVTSCFLLPDQLSVGALGQGRGGQAGGAARCDRVPCGGQLPEPEAQQEGAHVAGGAAERVFTPAAAHAQRVHHAARLRPVSPAPALLPSLCFPLSWFTL